MAYARNMYNNVSYHLKETQSRERERDTKIIQLAQNADDDNMLKIC